MTEAEARLQLGQREPAIALFKRIYNLFGPEGFRGEHRQYLALAEAE